jgi:hypothetical protein
MMAPSLAPSAGPPAVWLTRRALRLHAALFVVAPGCLFADGFELSRALSGHMFSWVYVFEWPLFAGFSVVAWWRLLHDDDDDDSAAPAAELELPRAAGLQPATAPDGDAVADEELRAWQDYLARLNARQRSGGPPAAR